MGVLHAMWASLLEVRALVAVKETILECGQTTSVSMPSALLVEAGLGAGLLLSRAGTVKERRTLPVFCRAGACCGVLEGATGEDIIDGHAGISSFDGRATCRPKSTSSVAAVVRVAPSRVYVWPLSR